MWVKILIVQEDFMAKKKYMQYARDIKQDFCYMGGVPEGSKRIFRS